MNLSKRMLQIALLAHSYAKIADIGCDHGKLDLFLAKHYGTFCIASDISRQAVVRLKKTVLDLQLEDRIQVVESDGLSHLQEKVDAVIISGMGSHTMIDIFQKNISYFQKISTYILSSQQDVFLLRKFMQEQGYSILDEVMVWEHNKYYPIVVFQKGSCHYSDFELRYGPVFLQKKEETYLTYLKSELYKKEEILNKISSQPFLKLQLKKEIKEIKDFL